MAFKIITQEYLDNFVVGTAHFMTEFASKVADLVENNDPDCFIQEQKLMAIQALEWSIRDYDINAEIFTEDELVRIEELITSIIQDCPM